MRAALVFLLLLFALPTLTQAEEATAEEKAQAAVDALVASCLKEKRDTDCIGQAMLRCVEIDLAPIEVP